VTKKTKLLRALNGDIEQMTNIPEENKNKIISLQEANRITFKNMGFDPDKPLKKQVMEKYIWTNFKKVNND
jgi:hypothetical protein